MTQGVFSVFAAFRAELESDCLYASDNACNTKLFALLITSRMKLTKIQPVGKDSRERFSTTFTVLLSNLAESGRSRKQLISVTADAWVAAFSLWLAYTLRHGQPFSDFYHTWYLFVMLPILTVGVFAGLGVYRWIVRSTNGRLFRQLAKGAIVSSIILLILLSLIPPERVNPRSLFVIYGMLLAIGAIGIRRLWQSLFDVGDNGEPVAIYGAGSAGLQLVNLLDNNCDYRPVAFIDDDPDYAGHTLAGLVVLAGNSPDLASELKRCEVNRIILAMPSLSSALYQSKLKEVDTLGIPVLTMPGISELMSGTAKVDDIRQVSIEDILGRSQVQPNIDLMCRRVTGKTVMVTGGGGSIGAEICRQIMKLSPGHLLILDNTEANLYHITEELELAARSAADVWPSFTPVLGSVTDSAQVNRLMAAHNVDTIFHAAAYKHVPIVEAQPEQGVAVNVFGTLTVLDAAIAHRVSDFVLISTDKAVRPTNVMGGTKRVAELVLQAKSRLQHDTRISMVRFGNVLGSSGSVVPKFREQIQSGGPVTLTHRDITRYFMTIPEAAQLVLQASAIAKGGDVFVLDMGEPVRIEQLAKTMVRLYGRKLAEETGNAQDIQLQVEGLRPGEKMYEELFISDSATQTEVAKIFTADEVWMEWGELEGRIAELRRLMHSADSEQIKAELAALAFMSDTENSSLLASSEEQKLSAAATA